MVYPQTAFLYYVSVKIIFSLFIVAITFPRLTIKKYLQATAYFYLISFAMAGAVIEGTLYSATTLCFFNIWISKPPDYFLA
jgi:hypothetical protein